MLNKWQNTLSLVPACLFSLLLITSGPSFGLGRQAAAATPINIAIIFDLSRSANSSNQSPTVTPKDLKSLLSHLFQRSSRNQYFIVGVSTTPTMILNGSTDSDATMKALSKLGSKREGATALYDACYLGIEKVAQGESSKRVLLVISDGVDTISDKTASEVKRMLAEKKVQLYAIVGRSKNNVYDGVLDEMASISGGAAFHYAQAKEISPILVSLAGKLRE
jgi:Ca-activated chloride channel homolog